MDKTKQNKKIEYINYNSNIVGNNELLSDLSKNLNMDKNKIFQISRDVYEQPKNYMKKNNNLIAEVCLKNNIYISGISKCCRGAN